MTWTSRMLVACVRGYRLLLSPWLGSHCRFTPSCSAYAIDALERHGAAAGSYLTARRLLRCHPGCAGGLDPLPTLFSFRSPAAPCAGAAAASHSSDDRSRAGMAP